MKLNSELPRGVSLKVSENTSNEWDWAIIQYGKALAGGHATTEKEAMAALAKVAGPLLITKTAERQTRATLKLKLKSWVERRPFLTGYIFREALAGVEQADIVNGAVEGERAEWKQERERCGDIIKPLSEHPLRTPAPDVATKVIGLVRDLGMKKAQLHRYTLKMFGPQFFTPSMTLEDALKHSRGRRSQEPELDGYGVDDDAEAA